MDLFFLTIMKAPGVKNGDITKKLPLLGFNSSIIYVFGTMVLPIMVIRLIIMTNFVIIHVPTHYNAILERPWTPKIKAIQSTFHQVIKYSYGKCIEEIWVNIRKLEVITKLQ